MSGRRRRGALKKPTGAERHTTSVRSPKGAGLFEALEATFDGAPDLVCLSHLRWNFVYQRPQHLMSRCARQRRVFFVEEPIFEPPKKRSSPHVDLTLCPSGVCVVVPRLPLGMSEEDVNE